MTPLLALLAAAALAAGDPSAPSIPYQQFRLSNGLNVIVSEDHTAPIVGVDVLYGVGSKDERPGRTGFAHLFEHLMFQGTEHLPKGEADRLIEAAGGSSNGGTTPDHTQYWEQVPSSALEQMLYVESERMGHLLATIDQAKLDNQREVVLNERRQTVEMQPYGGAWKALLENLWDPEFPYHWEVIGSPADLRAATLEDVKEFFRRWYGPGNATLAVVGDVDPARVRALAERWFGSIPASAPPERPVRTPIPLAAERRVELADDVQLPRRYLAWQTPRAYAPGDAALDLLADVLASGKSSRLVKRLVMDDRLAQGVSVTQESQSLASAFLVVATPRPGVPVERLQAAVDEELARIARDGPTPEEMERAHNRIESHVIFALEPVGGFEGRAAHLNAYQLETGDPGYLAKDLARYRAVTAADVQAAARQFVAHDRRVVLTVVPRAAPLPAPAAAATGEAP